MWSNEIIKGAGLGLRTAFIEEIYDYNLKPNWFEVAPENWIKKGGYLKKLFEKIRQDFPFICHGLSLSIGSPDPINFSFLKELKDFLDYYEIKLYSEHLSFSYFKGSNTYDLLPLPFTKEVADNIIEKLKIVQDFLNRQIAIENASIYLILEKEMEEYEFIQYIIENANCKLLLDINNVYVNSVNHGFNPYDFIDKINPEWVMYYHIAGHDRIEENLIIDTHGQNVIDEVYDLLRYTLETIGNKPVLLERDNNIPPYKELLKEYKKVKDIVENEKKFV
ncbi:DUF692 domain-containing protein [Hydrogenothermus marinus]|nr:DUF692 domain-containing protein [Hydrogenothermus marinus]